MVLRGTLIIRMTSQPPSCERMLLASPKPQGHKLWVGSGVFGFRNRVVAHSIFEPTVSGVKGSLFALTPVTASSLYYLERGVRAS
jgi:hypothetical protein